MRDRAGRALRYWAKTAVRALDSGAARNRSGVREVACSEGRSVNRGGPTAPVREILGALDINSRRLAHRFDDPDRPVPWQGFTSKGPTRIGDDVWCGAHVVVTSGVTIGERSVIGANSVVTTDIPPFSIAAGAPARVLHTIEYPGAKPA